MSIHAPPAGKVVFEFSAGYHGTPLYYATQNSALAVCGNSLIYYSLSGGANRHLLWGKGFGISNTAYHQALDWVAFADKGLKPSVHIYDCGANNQVAQLTEVSEMEVTAIAFSVDGSRICTSSREPDFRLILWDIDRDKGSVVKCKQSEIDWFVEYMSFSPVSPDRVCISGSGQLALWSFHRSFHRTSFTGQPLIADHYVPHSHAWASHSDIIYVGCTTGAILSFNVKPPPPKSAQPAATAPGKELQDHKKKPGRGKDDKQDDKRDDRKEEEGSKWHFLYEIESGEKISHICAKDGHLLVVGDGGHLRWITVPKEPAEEKKTKRKKGEKKNKRRKRKGRDEERHEENEDEKSDASHVDCVPRIVGELNLDVPRVTSMQYRSDGLQVLIGASNGLIMTVKVNIPESQLRPTSPDSYTTLEPTENAAEIEWESEFHDGAILAIGFIRGAKFMITAGQDSTVRCWTSDRCKELSRLYLTAAQTCLATSDKHNVVATGAANGALHVLKVDSIGRSGVVLYMKLHHNRLDQISFNGSEAYVVAASKADGRFFFLSNKSLDFEDLELIGYADLKAPILAHTWDIPVQGSEEFHVLLSLGHGEIVKLRVPAVRTPGGNLWIDNKTLRQISFRIPVPLNAIASGTYYLEKEEVERRVLWGFGADKKLQQYRLPENLSAWTGSDSTPHAPHFNIPGHQKAGSALALGVFEAVLITGGEDGAVQIRGRVFDPMNIPQRVLDARLYDGFSGGITCLAAVNGRIFTGGANGVILCCDTVNCGLRKGKPIVVGDVPTKAKTTRLTPEMPDHQEMGLSVVQMHEQNLESRYLLAGEPYRMELKTRIQVLKQEFQELYDKNLQAPELEKLSPKELLVDVALEKELRDELKKKVNGVVEEVRLYDLKKDVIVERIKKECYESMKEPEVYLYPFVIGHPVQSFPILKDCGFDAKLATLAKQLRIIEMREWHYIKQQNKRLAREAAELAAKEAAELAAKEAAQNAAFEAALREESSASEANAEGDLTGRDDSTLEDNDSVEEQTPIGDPKLPAAAGTLEQVSEARKGTAALKSPTTDAETASKAGTESTAAPPPSSAAGAPPVLAEVSDVDDDEEVELYITETSPAESFLYGTFDLTTSKRKRIQRYLLYMQLHEIRLAFNTKLTAAKQNKIQLIQKIGEMVVRIKELHKMLGGREFPFQALNESVEGMPDIFEVRNEEITVQKFMNKAERAKAEKQRIIDEEQKRLRAGSDAAERALHDMMGGKLERKIEVLTVETEIQRPKWMLGNPKGFTKEQHKEVKEFELMLKQMKEEKEKKIRGQEAEQRKLVSDIQEMTSSFDKECLDLFQQRIQDELKCAAIEESVSRFGINVEIEEFADERREIELSKMMEKLKSAKAQSVSALTEFRREVDAFREEYEQAIAEDKAQEKNFRKAFSDCGDQLGELHKAFQRRPMKASDSKGGGRNSTPRTSTQKQQQQQQGSKPSSRRGSFSGSPPPPKKAASTAAAPDPFYEKPLEVTLAQWDRLVDARNRKMQQEEEVKKLTAVMNEMQGCLMELTGNDDANRKQIEQVLRTLAALADSRIWAKSVTPSHMYSSEFRENREKKRKNMIVPLRMKQGLVEAELRPLEAEYSNVGLLPRSIIVECNEVVHAEANSKIDMMKKMKAWKAENNMIKWEITRLKLKEQHVTEEIRHLQLLRVTKANQNVIKTGEDPSSASEALALANRLEYNANLQEKRVADKEASLTQIVTKTDMLRRQNVVLLKTAAEVHKNYTFQYRICGNTLAALNKESMINQHFRTLNAKRKLKELSQEQAEQLLKLKEDYETTRARIIPLLPKVKNAMYNFPSRPLYSDIGHEYYVRIEQAIAMQYKKTGLPEFEPKPAKKDVR